MGPGNRADWAVSCPAGTHTLSTGARRRRLQGPGGKMQGGGAGNAQLAQTLATLSVADNGDAPTTLTAGSWSGTMLRRIRLMQGFRTAPGPHRAFVPEAKDSLPPG